MRLSPAVTTLLCCFSLNSAGAEKWLSTSTLYWPGPGTSAMATIMTPYARFAHAAQPLASGDSFLIHGGYTAFTGSPPYPLATNDTFMFNITANSWSTLAIGVVRPAARASHTWVQHGAGDYGYLFGGHISNTASASDSWAFDMSQMAWYSIPMSGISPPSVGQHSAVYDYIQDQFIIHGGYNLSGSNISPNTYRMSIYRSGSGQSVQYSGRVDSATASNAFIPTYSHDAVFVWDYAYNNTVMFIYGGADSPTHDTVISGPAYFQMYKCTNGIVKLCSWSSLTGTFPTTSTFPRQGMKTVWNSVNRELLVLAGTVSTLSQYSSTGLALFLPTSAMEDRAAYGQLYIIGGSASYWRPLSLQTAGTYVHAPVYVQLTRPDGATILVRHGGRNTVMIGEVEFMILYQGAVPVRTFP